MSTQATTRRARHKNPQRSRRRTRPRGMRWRTKGILLSTGLIAALFAWAAFARAFAPAGNTDRSRFDAIIVLGSPANAEGNPTPIQLGRVIEGVHEYERGVAPRLILTGGPTRRGYVEAHVMARTAQAMGVPASSIFEDPQAVDTIQNACYSVRIMQAHGWRSAEVVSSASHLPRAGLIFTRHPLEWRSHAAPALEPQGTISRDWDAAVEVLKTLRLLVYAGWAEKCG